MNKKSIRDVDLKGKRVFCRVDFNVPMKEVAKLQMKTSYHVRASSYNSIFSRARCESYFSKPLRPSKRSSSRRITSFTPVARRLGGSTLVKMLKKQTKHSDQLLVAQEMVARMNEGDVLVLESVRFYAGAKKRTMQNMRKNLQHFADIFVNDAFGACSPCSRFYSRYRRLPTSSIWFINGKRVRCTW